MLKLLKTPNSSDPAAIRLYGQLLAHIRQPVFYETMGVPDSFTGRFDLLLAHIFLIMNRTLPHKAFNQALFDVMFADMDQTLREQGIGDVGVPKHMKKMMKAFNGRMHAYQEALDDAGAFKDVLKRNLYGTVPDISADALARMTDYMQKTRTLLAAQDEHEILQGEAQLLNPQG